jgi:hypothetical protein
MMMCFVPHLRLVFYFKRIENLKNRNLSPYSLSSHFIVIKKTVKVHFFYKTPRVKRQKRNNFYDR